MKSLRIHPLAPAQVAQAYALVRLVASGLSLESWCDFASQRITHTAARHGGIHTVQDRHGRILGFASYTADVSLDDGRCLTVDKLVVVGTIERQREAVLFALLRALEMVAAGHRCGTIHFRLDAACATFLDRHTRALLENAGHHERYVLLSKELGSTD